MNLSRESFEIILDLIEIKMSTLQIHDKDDAREVNKLRKCRQELLNEFGPHSFKVGLNTPHASKKTSYKTIDS